MGSEAPGIDRIVLNSQIEKLIDSKGHDEVARHAIANFGTQLQGAKKVEVYGKVSTSGGKVSGETPGQGNVEIEDERAKEHEFSRGDVRERIGYYKIWRQPFRKTNWIIISDFWKTDEGTESETELARRWALALDTSGAEVWFGERAIKRLFRIPLSRHSGIEVSRELFVESWGRDPEKQHHAGYIIQVVIGRPPS